MFTWNLTGMQSRLFFPPRLAHILCIFTGAQTCRLIIMGFLFRWQLFSRNFMSFNENLYHENYDSEDYNPYL